MSCPRESLCVAVDTSGDVVTSTDPTGGASAWTVTEVGVDGPAAVSCPSAGLCVAADDHSDVWTSTDPTGGASAWTVTNVDSPIPGGFAPCSEPGDPLECVLSRRGSLFRPRRVDESVWTSTDPTGGASAWTMSDPLAGYPGALSCPSTSLCVTWGSLAIVGS